MVHTDEVVNSTPAPERKSGPRVGTAHNDPGWVAAVGLLLLADDRKAADSLHYVYGSLALGAILAPWMYAPAEGRKRLLWFAGTSFLAAALAVRAFMTGS